MATNRVPSDASKQLRDRCPECEQETLYNSKKFHACPHQAGHEGVLFKEDHVCPSGHTWTKTSYHPCSCGWPKTLESKKKGK